MMGGYYGFGMGPIGWLLMGLFWLALVGLIIWAVVRLLPARSAPAAADRDSAQDILDRRYARGEVDHETYQVQRATLLQARGEQHRSEK